MNILFIMDMVVMYLGSKFLVCKLMMNGQILWLIKIICIGVLFVLILFFDIKIYSDFRLIEFVILSCVLLMCVIWLFLYSKFRG